MIRNPAFAALILMAALVANAAAVQAAEVVMFDDPSCSWCRRWRAEIGPSYPHSPEGRLAPLRRVHIRDQRSAGVTLARPVNMTPTFVVVDHGREIGRLTGYAGRDFFYPMLGEVLGRLPRTQ